MSARTSRSRSVSDSSGSGPRRTRSCATTSGSSAVPPAATRRSASRNSVTSATRSLSRYPTLLVLADNRSAAYRSSTYCDSTRIAMSGHWARIASAARMPSSVKVGGIRTSATTRSGCSLSTAASSSLPSPAVAATSNPALSRSLVSPARSSTLSSPITSRSRLAPGSAVGCPFVGTGTTLRHPARPGGAMRPERSTITPSAGRRRAGPRAAQDAGKRAPTAAMTSAARDRSASLAIGNTDSRLPGIPELAARAMEVRVAVLKLDRSGCREDRRDDRRSQHPAADHGQHLAGPHPDRLEDAQVVDLVPGGHQHGVEHAEAGGDRHHQREERRSGRWRSRRTARRPAGRTRPTGWSCPAPC